MWPTASLIWTISKDPGWRSRLTTVPTRPKLRPPVIMHRFPAKKTTRLYWSSMQMYIKLIKSNLEIRNFEIIIMYRSLDYAWNNCSSSRVQDRETEKWHVVGTWIHLNEIDDLSSCNVHLDGIMNFNQWVRIADGSSVVCYQKWNAFWANADPLDLAELVLKKKNVVSIMQYRAYILVNIVVNVVDISPWLPRLWSCEW